MAGIGVKLTTLQVRELGRDIVLRHPEGIGGVGIAREIVAAHPEMATEDGKPGGTIRGGVWKLDLDFPDQITKIAGGKFAPKALGVTPEELRSVISVYQDAQRRIRHKQIDIDDAIESAAASLVPTLRRIAAGINRARSESGAAESCGHIGIDGVAALRLESYLKIKDKALDAADYPLDQLISRTGGERLT